jgi:hypothetical protein
LLGEEDIKKRELEVKKEGCKTVKCKGCKE